ncbi:MAG TPA: Flp pilus assembly protein CpaB [Actinomycetota bacterium]|jgi:pilus assembly protein CpaB|nr:Flp pilus assembly protein CpaB [Actinomycetota bacterium]
MRKLNLTIALGVVAALIGAGLVLAYGRSVEQRIADGRETVSVLVASAALPAGTAAEQLVEVTETKEIPRAYVAAGAVGELADLAGMVLSGPVASGGQLSETMFASPDEIASLKPERGRVAVAVQVDLSRGMARYVQPGSWVDVFVTYEDVRSSEGKAVAAGGLPTRVGSAAAEERTKLFLSGVKVLSVSVAPAPEGEEAESSSSQPAGDQVIAVLEVRPIDAERLVNGATLGQLYLGLSTEGESHQTPNGVTPDDVVKANRRKS